jgi:hypothetical protein
MARRRALVGVALLVVGGRSQARAQTFVERVDDDVCQQAATYDTDDQGPDATRARRACRLQRFSQRLTAERRASVMAGEQKRAADAQAWVESHEPTRVVRPIAVGLFVGSGIATYGLGVSWTMLRRLALDGWVGGRRVTFSDYFSGNGSADYTSKTAGVGLRWFFNDLNVSPYVGAGFETTSADLQAQTFSTNDFRYINGSARAHVVQGSAGLEVAYQGLRVSLEYAYAYAFYTQANDNDDAKTPDTALRQIWQDSVDAARNGVRFQVGYAF